MDGFAPLLIGNKGMLGRAWQNLLRQQGIDCVGVDIDEMDIADPAAVARYVVAGRSPVINCAAYTNVDAAEQHEDLATRVNGDAVGILAARCREVKSLLVHYSTDYVFRGDASRPYPIDQALEPLGAYGRSKRVGEDRLRASGADYLLIRTSWVYAPWAKNFVRTIAKLGRERESLKVVNDQRGRPTSAEQLAAVSLRLLNKRARGTFHVCDGGECTWFEFAREICRLAGSACQVNPCSSAEYPSPAKRPAYSVLDLTAAESLVGPMRPWRDSLADVMRRLED